MKRVGRKKKNKHRHIKEKLATLMRENGFTPIDYHEENENPSLKEKN